MFSTLFLLYSMTLSTFWHLIFANDSKLHVHKNSQNRRRAIHDLQLQHFLKIYYPFTLNINLTSQSNVQVAINSTKFSSNAVQKCLFPTLL